MWDKTTRSAYLFLRATNGERRRGLCFTNKTQDDWGRIMQPIWIKCDCVLVRKYLAFYVKNLRRRCANGIMPVYIRGWICRKFTCEFINRKITPEDLLVRHWKWLLDRMADISFFLIDIFRKAFSIKFRVIPRRWIKLVKVKKRDNESFSQLMRRFRKKVTRSKVLSEHRKRRFFTSKSEERRIEKKKAIRKMRRKNFDWVVKIS